MTKALDVVETGFGGRQNIIDNLSIIKLDKKQEYFLRLLADPSRESKTFTQITKEAGLTPISVMDLLRHASVARATAFAMNTLHEALPGVAKDLAEKAVDAKVECPECFGEKIFNGMPCARCSGVGKVMRTSDLDRQKIVLESTGIIKQKSGLNVTTQVNQQVGIMSPGNFFSKYVKDSDDAAYDIQDAEVVDGKT